MISNRISTIFFDVGHTLRITVPRPETQSYWLEKIDALLGLNWETGSLFNFLTDRLKRYKAWSDGNLVELGDYELWRAWLLPEHADRITPINAPELTRYSRKVIGDGVLLPNVKEVVSGLFKRGYRLGIISNTLSSDQTPEFLEEMDLARFFEVVVLSCKFGMKKPDPSIFLNAATQMGVNPANCAYVGDKYDRDVVGSHNANFQLSVLIEQGDCQPNDTVGKKPQPDYLIHNLNELLNIFPPFYTYSKNGHKHVSGNVEKRLWNISLSTMWSYERKISVKNLPDLINELAIGGIELNHNITTGDLVDLNLGAFPITSIHEPCPSDIPMATLVQKDWIISSENEENRCQGVRMVMRSIDLAANIGAKLLVIHPGNSGVKNHFETKIRELVDSGQKGSPEYQEQFEYLLNIRKENLAPRMDAVEKSLKELLEYAKKPGIKLSLENRYHVMDIPTIDEMERLLTLGDESQIGMQLDIGHAIVLDRLGFFSCMEWLERFGKRIMGVHLHDVRGLVDHFAPGLGDIDFTPIVKYIPLTAIRTLEIRGNNSMENIIQGLEILNKVGILNYKH